MQDYQNKCYVISVPYIIAVNSSYNVLCIMLLIDNCTSHDIIVFGTEIDDILLQCLHYLLL